jgi:glutamine synthetase
MAEQLGISITFMAKPYTDATGSGCHIHLSLWAADGKNRENLFKGEQTLGTVKNTSKLFANFLAGWLKYTDDCMVFYAPTVNSYKRYQTASWAPTRVAWSYDNRTAGYRIVGSGNSLRIENRIPGADCNPYLVFAASLASGLYGIEKDLKPPEQFEGNIYEAQDLKQVPKSLKEANDIFRNSKFAREIFGDDVVDHYAHFYDTEVNAYEKHVSDWERSRYFERI